MKIYYLYFRQNYKYIHPIEIYANDMVNVAIKYRCTGQQRYNTLTD